MEINVASTTYENLKRYWRRRKYQRLNGTLTNNKKKKKVTRLGGNCGRSWKIRAIPKLRLRIISPIKLLAKFHDAYIDFMTHLVCNLGNSKSINGVLRGRRIAKGRHVPLVSSGEEVDSRLVMEIYKNWSLLVN